jgi:hypothetical protein
VSITGEADIAAITRGVVAEVAGVVLHIVTVAVVTRVERETNLSTVAVAGVAGVADTVAGARGVVVVVVVVAAAAFARGVAAEVAGVVPVVTASIFTRLGLGGVLDGVPVTVTEIAVAVAAARAVVVRAGVPRVSGAVAGAVAALARDHDACRGPGSRALADAAVFRSMRRRDCHVVFVGAVEVRGCHWRRIEDFLGFGASFV